MFKSKIASLVLASILIIGNTGVTAFATESSEGAVNGSLQEHGKVAAYMALTDQERVELKSQLFKNLTGEQKATLLEKIGAGKGGASGQNSKGGKAKAFTSLTNEERAELRSRIFANLTDEERAALIEKIGAGKGGALGQNSKGGKSKVFQSMTDEEKALLRAESNSHRTSKQH